MKAPGSDEGQFATIEALAGVAREVEGLRTAVDAAASTLGRVEDLAKLIAGLAETVNTLAAKPGATPVIRLPAARMARRTESSMRRLTRRVQATMNGTPTPAERP